MERSKLKAVVFDANAYGRGRPNLESLRSIAQRLHMVGIEVWLPEPVALEWAHHLSEDWSQVVTAASEQRRYLKRAGLKAIESPYEDEAAVVTAALKLLSEIDYVEIVPLTETSAKKGLEDQILLRGPARRKEGVKTGASDSAWLRDVIAKAGAVKSLLFVSEDSDILKACESWGLPDPLMRKRADLRPTLFEVTVDEGGASHAVLSHIKNLMPINLDVFDGEQQLDIGATPGLEATIERDPSDYSDTRIYGAHLEKLSKLVGIDRVTIEVVSNAPQSSAEEATSKVYDELGPVDESVVTANVFFLADAEATVNRLYLGADPYVDTVTYEDMLVRATLVAELKDGTVTAVRPEGEASTYLGSTHFNNSEDALEALKEALSVVPGVSLPEDWTEDVFEVEVSNMEKPLVVELQQEVDQWQATLSVGDDYIEISCSYDVDARVGSGEDTFELYPPYVVTETSGRLPNYNNPIWSAAGWLIDQIG